jgi:lysophospholipase L1-like esterase
MKSLCLLTVILLCVLTASASAQSKTQPASELPKVVLIGDSIKDDYEALVAKQLAGKAIVVSPAASGGDSGQVLAHMEEWLSREKPAVVHLNCGLDDLKRVNGSKPRQVELAQYESNLRQIVARLRREVSIAVVFANTTPVLDGATEADVKLYNAAATARQTCRCMTYMKSSPGVVPAAWSVRMA